MRSLKKSIDWQRTSASLAPATPILRRDLPGVRDVMTWDETVEHTNALEAEVDTLRQLVWAAHDLLDDANAELVKGQGCRWCKGMPVYDPVQGLHHFPYCILRRIREHT